MSLLDCLGQERAQDRLQNYLQSGRVPHGMIFHGPEGVGKHLLAQRWAQLLLCSDQKQSSIIDACGQCDDCKLIQSGTHPDLHLVDKTLIRYAKQGRDRAMISLPIDVIREFVIEPAGVQPSRGLARVFIIDGVEQMNTATQNALLKTLEEPPDQTYLILVTSQPDRLLPTVLSRSQMVGFSLLEVSHVLKVLSEQEFPDQQSRYWADFSQGRLGLAMRLAKLEMYEVKRKLIEQVSQLSYENALTLASWIVEETKGFSQRMLAGEKDLAASSATRQGYQLFLELLSHGFQLALQSHSNEQTDQGQDIAHIAEKFGPLGCSEAIWETFHAQTKLEANVNATLLFESLMLQYLDCGSRLSHLNSGELCY
jgi:DNA polymerase-3 subunit delta'